MRMTNLSAAHIFLDCPFLYLTTQRIDRPVVPLLHSPMFRITWLTRIQPVPSAENDICLSPDESMNRKTYETVLASRLGALGPLFSREVNQLVLKHSQKLLTSKVRLTNNQKHQ
jgi:hypothetical protein